MPEVSVLMPAYNHERYIGKAIASVLAQTMQDWELIIVDDGSTDNTRQVVAAFTDPRIIYVHQRNSGCPAALNAGFQRSRAKFVSILASDDTLLPEALISLSEALRANPEVDVVYGDGYIIDENDQIVGELAAYRRMPFGDTLDSFVLASPVVGVHSAMIRRQSLESLDGPFDEKMLGYEDWDLFVRIKARGARFLHVARHVCCYRFHGANKSAPLSRMSERRRLALSHMRFRMINTDWFSTLSLSARQMLFLEFLTDTLQGDRPRQQEVTSHRSFVDLPRNVRSALLYRMAVSNILSNGARPEDRQTLYTAIRLDPTNLKAYALLALTVIGHQLPERTLARWRQAHAAPEPTDPVTRLLRARNVA